MSDVPMEERPWVKKFRSRLGPALPTLLVALVLAIDFDQIVYTLYLAFPLFYIGLLALSALIGLIIWVRAGYRYSNPAFSCLLLFMSSILLILRL